MIRITRHDACQMRVFQRMRAGQSRQVSRTGCAVVVLFVCTKGNVRALSKNKVVINYESLTPSHTEFSLCVSTNQQLTPMFQTTQRLAQLLIDHGEINSL